jgi:hypothetical protein
MKAYRGVDVEIHVFLTSAALPPGKEPPGTHWIGVWVGPITGLDDIGKNSSLYRYSNSDPSVVQLVGSSYTN